MRIVILTTDNREPHQDHGNPCPHFGPAPEALLQGFEHLSDVEVHVVSCLRKPVHTPEKLAPNIWYHSLIVTKIGWLTTGYQGCIRAARRKLRDIRPDIVHGQGTERDCSITAVFSGYPNVITIHGNMVAMAGYYQARMGSYYWFASWLETVVLKKTAGVFCNSTYTRALAAPRARQTWLVPNPLRLPFFSTPPSLAHSAKPLLLNVGIISPYKRQIELLEVAASLWRTGLQFEMQFAGHLNRQTEYGAAFSQKMKEAAAAGYARYLGPLPVHDLLQAFDAASALVHFSLEESFGLVVAEALARNLKLFAAAVGGVVDIAAQVEGAELFAPDDMAGLTNAIARWIAGGYPRPTTASRTMLSRYHPATIARRHVDIYREILETSR